MYVFDKNFNPLTVDKAIEIWLKNPEHKLLWVEESCSEEDIEDWEEIPHAFVELEGNYYSFRDVSLKDVVARGLLPRSF
ncbi:MAG: hypothetical protein J7647_13500 [Cyanobacteria bacterium SBLK]|nr:hypothetical protein [Cyanobacteria bacterium SBLK]